MKPSEALEQHREAFRKAARSHGLAKIRAFSAPPQVATIQGIWIWISLSILASARRYWISAL
jgi:hypothetical protein